MTLLIASDHAGFNTKESLKIFLENQKIPLKDLGPFSNESTSYSLFAQKLCEELFFEQKKNPEARGILLCGSGIGMSITANRFSHVRAAVCHSEEEALLFRKHNNGNILCLGARMLPQESLEKITYQWLHTSFEEGRHKERLQILNTLGTVLGKNL